ncbi:glycoside hydrolase family 3 N-terminal domain-containing protein [Rhizosphaericola mali]|uniref:Beta-glucosidase n=1 Tax=Rhizosphaericola mali TaxID=2545455 RepID=A0A5P2G2U4_9BACT|nr:glycoside hydrolase family 3 N-terminal domain-containing protein [Rhizosphaericola mali]QES89517.1 beta-glucosidase [Rhizosphaericola mali]
MSIIHATAQSNPPKWIDFNKNGKLDIYEDASKSISNRVENLLSQMTLNEKANQLATLYGYGAVLNDRLPTEGWKDSLWKYGIGNIDEQLTGLRKDTVYAYPYSSHAYALNIIQKWFIEETRLGIPVDFTSEGIRGLNHMKATYFPSQLAQANSFDRALIYDIGKITGKEGKVLGYTNIYSPILDVATDPRWGRVEESYGSEPYLISQLGKQQILGIQSNGIASTVKHFAAYSIPIGGRDGNVRANPQMTPRELWEIYLEPFRVAFLEARPMGVMASYNDYDGEPIIGSYYFLTEILRKAFQFSGYVVSDSEAFEYLFSKHHVAKDATEAAAMALHAGMNVRTNFDQPKEYLAAIKQAVKTGKLSEADLDKRVSEVLSVKFRLGLFDHPYIDEKAADTIVHNTAAKHIALTAAHESIVLLKNEQNILPLDIKKYKNIAIIGPNAKEIRSLLSRYGPVNSAVKTVYDGISDALPSAVNLNYTKGLDHIDEHFPQSDIQYFPLDAAEQDSINVAVNIAKKSDVIILVVGDNLETVGESKSRLSLDLPGHQNELVKEMIHCKKPIIFIHVGGRPTSYNLAADSVNAILETYYLGEYTGNAIADVIFGKYNPSGKLATPILKNVGQIPLTFPQKMSDDAGGNASEKGFLYPFGFGLSYSKFVYSNLYVTVPQNWKNDSVSVQFQVENISNVDGTEIMQIYIKDSLASLVPYTMRLREFARVNLKAGESKKIAFKLPYTAFSMYNKDLKMVVEPGQFVVMVGASSEDIRLKKVITL